jgi:hypothetical protein
LIHFKEKGYATKAKRAARISDPILREKRKPHWEAMQFQNSESKNP